MQIPRYPWFPALGLLSAAYLCVMGCDKDKTSTQTVAAPKDLVARVNGAPITEFDLRQESRGHGGETLGPQREAALESVVRSELLAQQAVLQGIDQDPLFHERMAKAEALYRAARRRELADVLFRRAIIDKTNIGEDQAKTYFQANEARMKTELHILQLMSRDETQARRTLDEIKAGATFEQVAAKQFDKLPETPGKPWDLGFLRWRQLPPVWRGIAYDLKVGETSDIIKGEGNRFWIIQVVERREDATATFDSLKVSLMDDLKAQLIEKERNRLTEELRKKATVVREARPPQPVHP